MCHQPKCDILKTKQANLLLLDKKKLKGKNLSVLACKNFA